MKGSKHKASLIENEAKMLEPSQNKVPLFASRITQPESTTETRSSPISMQTVQESGLEANFNSLSFSPDQKVTQEKSENIQIKQSPTFTKDKTPSFHINKSNDQMSRNEQHQHLAFEQNDNCVSSQQNEKQYESHTVSTKHDANVQNEEKSKTVSLANNEVANVELKESNLNESELEKVTEFQGVEKITTAVGNNRTHKISTKAHFPDIKKKKAMQHSSNKVYALGNSTTASKSENIPVINEFQENTQEKARRNLTSDTVMNLKQDDGEHTETIQRRKPSSLIREQNRTFGVKFEEQGRRVSSIGNVSVFLIEIINMSFPPPTFLL